MKIVFILLILVWMSTMIVPSAMRSQATDVPVLPGSPKPDEAPVYFEEVQARAEEHFARYQGGYKQYKRMEQYALSRLGSDGQIVNSSVLNYRAYQEAIASQSLQRIDSYHGDWNFIGPSGTNTGTGIKGQGRVNRIAFHPTNPSIVYASTAGGGLWKTTNKGITWYPLSDGLPVMNTSGVAVDFVNPDILYLLTGDGDGVGSFYGFNEFTRTSVGVFKSTDGGDLWKPTGLVFDEGTKVLAYNLYMNPEDQLTLFACTTEGVHRTQDGGASWDLIRSGRVYELEFKPGDADRIYCVDNDYIYVSDNGGDTWIDSTLIPEIDGRTGRMTITTCDDNPAIVYLLASPIDTLTETDTLPDHRGLWVSTNSGADFTLVSTRPNLHAGTGGDEFKSQAWYDLALECNPYDDENIFVGTIGMWFSSNGGVSMQTNHGINSMYHADIHDLKFNPLDTTLYVATDGGVFTSEDFGASYQFRSGILAITQYYKIANSPFDSDYVLAGSQDNGVHLKDDNSTFLDRVVWGDGMESLFHPSVDSFVLTSVQAGEIHRSLDGGETYTRILGPFDGDTAQWTTPMAFDANNHDVIYLGFNPVWKSTDGGDSFNPISVDTISGHRLLETNLSNPARVYAGDCRNCGGNIRFEMYMSPNAGATWSLLTDNPGFPDKSFVTDATINPDNSQEIWISCGRYSYDKKVFKSTNAGASWTNMTGSLPNVPVNAIIYEDNNGSPSGSVYIATDIGVFYRNDVLEDWIQFSNKLPAVEVTDLDIDYNGGFLRASTYGRGMWQSELFNAMCEPTITLTMGNQAIGHSYFHQATDLVTSTAVVDGAGSVVQYKCEQEIRMTPGFKATAENGALFGAFIHPCGQGGLIEFVTEESETETATK